jgi:hypothetical protein
MTINVLKVIKIKIIYNKWRDILRSLNLYKKFGQVLKIILENLTSIVYKKI